MFGEGGLDVVLTFELINERLNFLQLLKNHCNSNSVILGFTTDSSLNARLNGNGKDTHLRSECDTMP